MGKISFFPPVKWVIGFVVSIGACCVTVHSMLPGGTLEEMVAGLFAGYFPLGDGGMNPVYLMISVIPFLFTVVCYGNVMESEFEKVSVYVFTRSKSRVGWIVQKYLQIGTGVGVLCVVAFSTAIPLFSALGHAPGPNALKGLSDVGLLVYTTFMPATILVNLLALLVGSKYAVCVGLTLDKPLLFLLSQGNWQTVLKLVPSAQQIYGWHEANATGISLLQTEWIEHFPCFYSFSYNVVWTGFLILCGIAVIQRLDAVGTFRR